MPDTLSLTDLYHRGGAIYSETILAACLAAGDKRYNEGAAGLTEAIFAQRLQSSIELDGRRFGAGTLGNMLVPSEYDGAFGRPTWSGTATYSG